MRRIFKTHYNQDIDLFRDGIDRNIYCGLLVILLLLPLSVGSFWLGEISYALILSITSVGLMLLTGFAGQVSIGHGAFVGIGAYANAVLLTSGLPLPLSIIGAVVISTLVGALLGYPALRLSGLYLAMATLAFTFIVEHVFVHWESMTGGFGGMSVPAGVILNYSIMEGVSFYYLCLLSAVGALLLARNILRSPTGRAFVSIRDSEVAAQSMGVNLASKKTTAFALSAGFAGLSGALLAHRIGSLAPDAFGVLLSIQLLLMVVVGGLGSLHGAIFGAIFVSMLPQIIAVFRDTLPDSLAQQPGLEPGLFGAILVAFVLFEPAGINGRWQKVKAYFAHFPMHRKATFRRQKNFTKSERFR
ncbi:branched-chain amino acid ABC transporter permease [Bradyrhizobium sp. 1]|uniref:branched-chain amino acid ABC transporter permease n=1 Tax=Bradyrhizobium sp. 1 TaxID=241591 RepID=UPI001FF76394|nr:branched-chain amino acid ABC transporter permease [Bradyrhizobium sp. 1]MCK1394466.1 branched-chain amino acid ABC transporter permease [Bradyrhizobium sp. 1]